MIHVYTNTPEKVIKNVEVTVELIAQKGPFEFSA